MSRNDDRPPLQKARTPQPWDPAAGAFEPAMSAWLAWSETAFGAWRGALGATAGGGAPQQKAPPMPAKPTASASRKSVVLINTFVVPAAFEDGFLQWWRLARLALSSQPGFVSARLHRSLDAKERYRFVNIAEWESPEAYHSALSRIWTAVPKPSIPGFEWHPMLYEVVENV